IATVIAIGFRLGKITLKNISIGPPPSIITASSISSGIDFTKPLNKNTERPEPKPRYISKSPTGLSNPRTFAVFVIVNITIWNGTTIENTNMKNSALDHFVFTRVKNQPVIDVKNTIAATENTVINKDIPKAEKKPIF